MFQTAKQLPCWSGVAEHWLDTLFKEAEIIHVDEGSVIIEQFKSASDFYLLCEGSIDHFVTLLDSSQQPLPVGRLNTAWSAIGWSGFVEPHRYTTQVRCSTPSTLVRWNYNTLQKLINDFPEISRGILSLVTDSSKVLLEQSRSLLNGFSESRIIADSASPSRPPRLKLKPDTDTGIKYLSYSNLFQELTLNEMKHLAGHCWVERYSQGIDIFSENEPASDVIVLIKGTVNLYYSTELKKQDQSISTRVFVRSLSQPGHIVSWASLTNSQRQDITAIAEDNVTLCCIPADVIKRYCRDSTDFSIKLQKKLLQIIGSRLRSTRALLINQHTGNEQDTVSSLLHNLGPQLAIHSALHKIPPLLRDRTTQEDAFSYLDHLQKEGGHFEKNVAGLCSDILRETRRECKFFQGLRGIYQKVVTSNIYEDTQKLRNLCAAEFVNVYSNARYLIQGEHNLPDSSGHIFVLNHLISHPYHKLPNGFEFSLDTHFVSSMILYKKYGDSGIRVVRKNRSDEYAHESYYQRLGHIYVYTNESQPAGSSNETADWREKFFTDVSQCLQQGNNIIICPEGTSYWSKDSPGPFKSGAFRLAAMQEAETLIVPIVVANFDKPLSDTVFTAIVKPPIKINDVLEPHNPNTMNTFLAALRLKYKTYLTEAQYLSTKY